MIVGQEDQRWRRTKQSDKSLRTWKTQSSFSFLFFCPRPCWSSWPTCLTKLF